MHVNSTFSYSDLIFVVHVFFRGVQTINLTVTNGGPLPFAYDILTAAFEYGNRAFTQYPPDIPDYFKQTFPDGYSWERIMEFEDGAKCEVKSVIRLVKSKT